MNKRKTFYKNKIIMKFKIKYLKTATKLVNLLLGNSWKTSKAKSAFNRNHVDCWGIQCWKLIGEICRFVECVFYQLVCKYINVMQYFCYGWMYVTYKHMWKHTYVLYRLTSVSYEVYKKYIYSSALFVMSHSVLFRIKNKK